MKWRETYHKENPNNVPQDWPPRADPSKVPPEIRAKQEEIKKAKEAEEAKAKEEGTWVEPPKVEVLKEGED